MDELTESFLSTVDFLFRSNVIKNQLHLGKILVWNNTGVSLVMNRKRGAPSMKCYKLFRFMVQKEIPDNYGFFNYFLPDLKREIVNENLDIKTYSLDQIIEALKAELKDSYGGLSRDEQGRELQTPYMVIGIVTAAFDRLK